MMDFFEDEKNSIMLVKVPAYLKKLYDNSKYNIKGTLDLNIEKGNVMIPIKKKVKEGILKLGGSEYEVQMDCTKNSLNLALIQDVVEKGEYKYKYIDKFPYSGKIQLKS